MTTSARLMSFNSILFLVLVFIPTHYYAEAQPNPRRVQGAPIVLVSSNSQPDTLSCSIAWQPGVQVSRDSDDAIVPKVAQSGDTLHVVYFGDNGGGIFYTRSTNNGYSWDSSLRLVSPDSIALTYSGQIACSGERVYVLYTQREVSPPYESVKVIVSSDAGNTWSTSSLVGIGSEGLIRTLADTTYAYYLDETDSNRPYIARSSDFGLTWQRLSPMPAFASNMQLNRRGIQMVAELPGVEVHYYHSGDFGISWDPPVLLSTVDSITSDQPFVATDGDSLLLVAWRDGKYGSIGGFAAAILSRRSTDAGVSWEDEVRHDSLPAGNYPAIGIEAGKALLIWDDSRTSSRQTHYRFSIDSTRTWCPESAIPPLDTTQSPAATALAKGIAHVFYIRSYPSFQRRVFHRRGEIQVTGIREIVPFKEPSEIVLFQNYPNPFNTMTKITFMVQSTTAAKLSVYDLLGKEVATLLHAEMNPGTYDVFWNADRFASGVYWYSVQVGKLIRTRRMLLLR